MKITYRKVKVLHSESKPELTTENERLEKVIKWLDKHPVAYEIVTGTKSKGWGKGSTHYSVGGGGRLMSTETVLWCINTFMEYALGKDVYSKDKKFPADICNWSARFTLDHYNDKGFRGGKFDCVGFYNSYTLLDYTPDTLDEVIERFKKRCEWDDAVAAEVHHEPCCIKLNGRVVYPEPSVYQGRVRSHARYKATAEQYYKQLLFDAEAMFKDASRTGLIRRATFGNGKLIWEKKKCRATICGDSLALVDCKDTGVPMCEIVHLKTGMLIHHKLSVEDAKMMVYRFVNEGVDLGFVSPDNLTKDGKEQGSRIVEEVKCKRLPGSVPLPFDEPLLLSEHLEPFGISVEHG